MKDEKDGAVIPTKKSNKERVFYLYRHCYASGPKAGHPFYIGVGVKPTRYRQINREYKRAYEAINRTAHWKNITKKYGYAVEIILDGLTDIDELYLKEKEFISLYGREVDGGILCNITKGGEGAFGSVVSDITKKKISIRNKGKTACKAVTDNRTKYFKETYCDLVICNETQQSFNGYTEAAKCLFPTIKSARQILSSKVKAGLPYKGYSFSVIKRNFSIGATPKLDKALVANIKRAYNAGYGSTSIGRLYGVSHSTVLRIVRGFIFQEVSPHQCAQKMS